MAAGQRGRDALVWDLWGVLLSTGSGQGFQVSYLHPQPLPLFRLLASFLYLPFFLGLL